MPETESVVEVVEKANSSEKWETWTLRALLGFMALVAVGVWNDVHDMKSDLRAHIAAEEKTNAFQDFRLGKHADILEANKADVAKLDGRIKVAEYKLGIH